MRFLNILKCPVQPEAISMPLLQSSEERGRCEKMENAQFEVTSAEQTSHPSYFLTW
jgi:hypothetical protein